MEHRRGAGGRWSEERGAAAEVGSGGARGVRGREGGRLAAADNDGVVHAAAGRPGMLRERGRRDPRPPGRLARKVWGE